MRTSMVGGARIHQILENVKRRQGMRALTNTREFLQYIHDYTEVFQKRQRSLLIWLSEGCFIKIKAQYFGKEKVGTLANLSARF